MCTYLLVTYLLRALTLLLVTRTRARIGLLRYLNTSPARVVVNYLLTTPLLRSASSLSASLTSSLLHLQCFCIKMHVERHICICICICTFARSVVIEGALNLGAAQFFRHSHHGPLDLRVHPAAGEPDGVCQGRVHGFRAGRVHLHDVLR